MPKYLIDTNILIEHFKNNPLATQFLGEHPDILIPYVVVAELIQGARDSREQAIILELVNAFEIYYANAKVSRNSLQILENYYLKNGMGFLDALIAGCALATEAILVTLNVKHFSQIEGLEVIKPF